MPGETEYLKYKNNKQKIKLTWRYVGAETSAGDHDIGLIGPIKRLACTAIYLALNKTQ